MSKHYRMSDEKEEKKQMTFGGLGTGERDKQKYFT